VAEGEVTQKVSEALQEAYYGPLMQEQQEQEEKKSFLELLIDLIRAKHRAAAPKLESATGATTSEVAPSS